MIKKVIVCILCLYALNASASIQTDNSNNFVTGNMFSDSNLTFFDSEDSVTFANSNGTITVNSSVTNAPPLSVVGNIQIQDGNQAVGRVLTSDANGVASWQDAGSVGGGGGCNWSGMRCSCGHDTGGSVEGFVISGMQCTNGVITDFRVMRVVLTSGGIACPASQTGCDIYQRP